MYPLLLLLGAFALLQLLWEWGSSGWPSFSTWLLGLPDHPSFTLVLTIVWAVVAVSLIRIRFGEFRLINYATLYGKWLVRSANYEEGKFVPSPCVGGQNSDEVANITSMHRELTHWSGRGRRLCGIFWSPRTILAVIIAQSALWPVDLVVRPVVRTCQYLSGRQFLRTIRAVITLKDD